MDQTADSRRPRDASATRGLILAVAQALFAETGYAAASTREVAKRAGVDRVLIGRYFGSKEQLFRAALTQSFDLVTMLAGARAELGARVRRTFAETHETPPSLAMMVLSMNDPQAQRICRDLMREHIIDLLAAWIGDGQAEAAAEKLVLLWTGYFMAQRLVRDPAMPPSPSTLDWVAQTTSEIVAPPCA